MSLNKGWTWISFNVVMSDMSINTVFSGLTTLASDDAIKNQMVFTNYYVRRAAASFLPPAGF